MIMKNLKYSIHVLLMISLLIACNKDDGFTDTTASVPAPTNVSALVSVTQDNSGLVTITPLGEGVVNFKVNYGVGLQVSELLEPGESTQFVYEEGVYQLAITATGINAKTTTVNQEIIVSFQAPQNLVVSIENDTAISRQVNVTATADLAMSFEVNYGDPLTTVIMANIGETASFVYPDVGLYTISVTAFSAAVETTVYTEEFLVTEIVQPLVAAPQAPSRDEADVISMFSNAYINDVNVSSWRADWSTSILTDLQIAGDDTKSYVDADFVGVEFYGTDAVNADTMEFFHMDIWTLNATTFRVKLVDLGGAATEAEIVFDNINQGEWVSLEIPMSDFINAGMTATNSIQQLIFSGLPTGTFDFFIDNVYFYKSPTGASPVEGTWKVASEPGALMVGPNPNSGDWWSLDAQGVIDRACYLDDTYVFAANGAFSNSLGADTWIEPWQGGTDACGVPVAPHDGSATATYNHDQNAGTITINGTGAYLGLPKAVNAGELPNVAVPASITYSISFIDNDTMTVIVEAGAGVFWTYKLVRDITAQTALEGVWTVAAEAGALMVGPNPNSGDWWSIDAQGVIDRACYFDDTYVFSGGGMFANVLGADTWIEGWQGGTDACGAPVAPHDGSVAATYFYDDVAGTLLISGTGAYLGLAKPVNAGELPNVAVPSSITYDVSFLDADTMIVMVEAGAGVFWTYKLTRN